jgi:hypothetical protein
VCSTPTRPGLDPGPFECVANCRRGRITSDAPDDASMCAGERSGERGVHRHAARPNLDRAWITAPWASCGIVTSSSTSPTQTRSGRIA